MHLNFIYMSCVVHCKLIHPSFHWYSNKIILTHSSSTCFAEHTEHLLLLIKSHPKRPKNMKKHITLPMFSPNISFAIGFPHINMFQNGGSPKSWGVHNAIHSFYGGKTTSGNWGHGRIMSFKVFPASVTSHKIVQQIPLPSGKLT